MKKKFSRILGVGLVIALVTSLITMAIPASASDLLWSTQATPSALTFQVASGTDASLIKVAPDGTTIFVVDSQATTDVVYKSANSGLTWTASVLNPWTTTSITAMEISPNFATDSTVVVTAGNLVYISTTAGAYFGQLGGAVATGEIITSLALSPTYSAGGEIMVGTTNAAAATYGGVYIWNKLGVLNWAEQTTLDEDITSVAFSPNYPIDATILAIGSDAAGTQQHTKVSTFAWDATIGAEVSINAALDVGSATAIVSSSLVMGSDYNGSVAATRRTYVATVSGLGSDDIYRVTTAATAMNPTSATDDAFVNLAYSGDITTGTLFASQNATALVYRSANPTATIGWVFYPPTTPPTGAANSHVALAPDFATSNTLYVGTTGAESAVSKSTDGGVNFYQTGMVDTTLNHFEDFQPSPAYATDNTLFLVTSPAAAGTATDGNPESLWKSTDSGVTWIRILALDTVLSTAVVRPSPDYATDSTIYFAETGVGATAIRYSSNAGSSWLPRISSVAINDMLVSSASTIFTANVAGGTVARSTNNGWTWSAKSLTGSSSVHKLAEAPNGDIVAGTNAGYVYVSSDTGTTYTIRLAGLGGGNVNQIAIDTNYATNGAIYAASSGVAGIWRVQTGDIKWNQILTTPVAGAVTGLVTGTDGTLYATDATAASATAGGILRSLTPTILAAYAPATFEVVSTGDGLTAAYTLQSLFATPATGSATLLAIENSGGAAANRIVTYTDTILEAPVLSAGATSTVTASFDWTTITGATSYQLAVNTRSDFLGTAQTISYVAPFTSGTAISLSAGTTYYGRVRVAVQATSLGSPILSRWSDTVTIQTITAAVAAPVAIRPLPASQDIDVKPSFSWGAVAGAASYTIELADNPEFTDATTANATINAWLSPDTLEYDTTYYWRVTAVATSGAPASAAIVGVFTTEAEAAEATTTAAAAVSLSIVAPVSGSTVSTEPTFVWTAYEGAINYEVVVSTDDTFAIIEYSHTVPVTNTFYKSETLSNDTTYYWRVRGVTGKAVAYSPAPGGEWETGVFTTEAIVTKEAQIVIEPTPPTKIEVVEVPVATPGPETIKVVEVPVQTVLQEEIPSYLLWTIIGVGAALIVALIVLIARTRRVT